MPKDYINFRLTGVRAIDFSEASCNYQLASVVPAGADRLFFLPYLNGERLAKQANSRAQFVGLTSAHSAGHLHRAVMEGVAFPSRRNIEIMKSSGNYLERLVAAGGAPRPDSGWRSRPASTIARF